MIALTLNCKSNKLYSISISIAIIFCKFIFIYFKLFLKYIIYINFYISISNTDFYFNFFFFCNFTTNKGNIT